MKKKIIIAALVLLVCVCAVSVAPDSAIYESRTVVAETPEKDPLETRFLNMLNHNFVYGEDFASFDKIALGSILSMLSSREGNYISETYVKGFALDMYGINIVSFNESANVPHKDGFVYIPPMGYTKYLHENAELSKNEDGTFTVVTDVTVTPHDGAPYKTTAISLFAPDENSSLGYVIVYSSINEQALSS